jgi:hypothetical protein
MNLKWTTIVVIVVGALGVWRMEASKPDRAGRATMDIDAPEPVVARGAALAKEIARLHDRAEAGVSPRLARNLFHFVTPPPRPAPVALVVNRASDLAAALPQPALKLIGVAEDTSASGLIRTAIISGPGQVYVVKEGERVTSRYLVARISADVVELQDLSNVRSNAVDDVHVDAGFRRLALK